jgi:hypothetical protein
LFESVRISRFNVEQAGQGMREGNAGKVKKDDRKLKYYR